MTLPKTAFLRAAEWLDLHPDSVLVLHLIDSEDIRTRELRLTESHDWYVQARDTRNGTTYVLPPSAVLAIGYPIVGGSDA